MASIIVYLRKSFSVCGIQCIHVLKREKSLGGIHEQVSVMLNIKLTLSGGEGLVCDIFHMTEVATSTVKSYCC